MPHPTLCSRIEPLETRIAPALFFVGASAQAGDPHNLSVTKGGAPAGVTDAEVDAAELTGATVAVLLGKGDQLIFDADNSGTLTRGDSVMMKVTGGRAMVFLTDAPGGTEGAFDRDEITGVAFGKGFQASINGGVRGAVLGALKADGTIETVEVTVEDEPQTQMMLQPDSSISGLTVTGGVVRGAVAAGGAITKVSVAAVPVAGDEVITSVGGLLTGTATQFVSVSFNAGEESEFRVAYTQPEDTRGGDISNIRLAQGVYFDVKAGDGGTSTTGKAAQPGGSISGVKIASQPVGLSLWAGAGGSYEGEGKGGAGGFVRDVAVTMTADVSNGISALGGDGGTGAFGGVGGAVTKIKAEGQVLLGGGTFRGGQGGDGELLGGAGGSVSGIRFMAGAAVEGVNVHGGDAGEIVRNESGRTAAAATVVMTAGAKGGDVRDVQIVVGTSTDTVSISSGDGGEGTQGGAAGAIVGLTGGFGAAQTGIITGGVGGNSTGASGRGGVGGGISKSVFAFGDSLNALTISGGAGGTSAKVSGVAGGSVNGLTLFLGVSGSTPPPPEFTGGIISVTGGAGGDTLDAATTKTRAGAGGAVSNLRVAQDSLIDTLNIKGGLGGFLSTAMSGGVGIAGRGGDVTKIQVASNAPTTGKISLVSGEGGGVRGETEGNGGDSGNISTINIRATTAGSEFEIYAGQPADHYSEFKNPFGSIYLHTSMDGQGEGADGGKVGTVSKIVLNAPESLVRVGAPESSVIVEGLKEEGSSTVAQGTNTRRGGASGGTGPDALAGDGGLITDIRGVAGTLQITGTAGGEAGVGGDGGSVSKVSLTGGNLHYIVAGDAGNGLTTGKAGSITGIKTKGDIGNFAGVFDPSSSSVESMGGIFAGMGAGDDPAGSITGVTAARIAAIMAGRPAADAVGSLNAVARLAAITATSIGADLDNDATFDFTAPEGVTEYEVGQGYTPIDGFVLVREGGFLKVKGTILKKIEVPVVTEK